MKHKIKAQFSILLSIIFSAFLSFGNVFAIKPMVGMSSNFVSLSVGASEQIVIDATDFYGDIKVTSANNAVATAKFIGCDTISSCTVRNRTVILAVQGISQGSTSATVSFTGTISSRSIKISETQNVNITVQNSDPSLASLQISPVSINFNKDITEYTVSVEHDVASVSIAAIPVDSSTVVTGTGTFNLTDYTNTFEIIATATNGATCSYKINVKRKDETGRTAASSKKSTKSDKKSSDNTLSDILIPGYDIKMEEGVTEYKITVKPDASSIMVHAIPNDEKATVEVEGNDNIEFGENIVKIMVKAETGEIKDYVIRVTRPSNEEEALAIQKSEDGNREVLGATSNGKGFNILPIIITVASVFIGAGAVTTIVFLKKRSSSKRKQFNVMRVNNGFRPGSIR